MPKWDKTRNYYADLELQPSASPDEIKKQFKKLALKYHPDRNPGREAEVNPKFQIIQSAHEILTDDTLKKQYDEARRTYSSRYPGSSGVKGNPWQDAAKAYPPPPRRQPNPQTRPTSGAQRYENFASGMPRNARPRTPKDDPQFRRSNAEAWDHIRPNASRRNTQTRPTTPGRAPPGRAPTSATRESRPAPTPPPRTAYQKQKQEAAFGTGKKTGFTPRSSVADEPPVTNKNYYTNRTHSNLFTEPESIPETATHNAGASAAADPFAYLRDHFVDNRQRTPYHTPGGERTSLFDSSPGLGRSTSTRTPPRPFEMPGSFPRPRPRSASPARGSSNDGGSEDSAKENINVNGVSSRNAATAQPKASGPQPATASYRPSPNSTTASSQPNGNGSSVYASQNLLNRLQAQFTTATTAPRPSRSSHEHYGRKSDRLSYYAGYQLSNPSSDGNRSHNLKTLYPIERNQRETLNHLVKKYSLNGEKGDKSDGQVMDGRPQQPLHKLKNNHKKADANSASFSFGFRDGPNVANTNATYNTFTRNSTENINTRFVDDEMVDDWQFKAGSASANEATTPSKPRPQSRNRPIRRPTPLSKPSLPTRAPQAQEAPGDTAAGANGFSAGVWNEKIGSQHFEPQSTNSTSTSPTRRTNSRRSKSFKMTAGTAAVVDEESESPSDDPGPPFTVPDAMDIDTPPTEKAKEAPKAAQANSARPYFTEPHRPDWRAGDINGVASKTSGLASSTDGAKDDSSEINGPQPVVSAADHVPSKHVGSEDSEEFRTTFSDFRKVEPFMDPSPSGLGSFADLKSTLPFKSQPSEQIPLDTNPADGPLEFPPPPVAPRLPPTMGVAGLRPNNSSFRKYAQDFNNYMDRWDSFNNKVITHFSTRQEEFKSRRLRRGANWLEDGARDYLTEVDQDLDVQKKYFDACTEHRKRVAEYMDFRDRVR
ncbi:hypothetical protein F5B22DRAFT_447404 [Xylaria bambusicola]|uniref:uncharacterized protein n=1 Tax=Xylaria bambusicola TaxID=326684 RepID=UPI002007989C|nr:uncharacterized protein F5B22DRAFT_447404 [Xylaria bambusicola]KAI0506435.1 hypothetical protein F5B22DRAFT_447404 [Xylaria bambusicola]